MPEVENVAETNCDHFYASHIRGGELLHVRLCMLCHEPDWRDLAEQVAAIRRADADGIAQAIEAYEPDAHPVVCPPSIAYRAAQEKAADIARQYTGGGDRG